MHEEYDIEIYSEKEFTEKYPKAVEISDKIIDHCGIDKSKYEFYQCVGDTSFLIIGYALTNEPNIDMSVTLYKSGDSYKVREIDISSY
jgi:hypothetical protein